MKHSLILIGLIFTISAIDCDENLEFQIKNLCPKDVFTYEDKNGVKFEVNTVVTSQFNISLSPLFAYLIDYPTEYFLKVMENKDQAIKIAELAKSFDKKINEIYRPEYIENDQKFNNIESDLKLIQKLYLEINDIRNKHIKEFIARFVLGARIDSGRYLVKSLDFYRRNKLESTPARLAQFTKFINQIRTQISNKKLYNLRYVFAEDSMVDIFTKSEIIKKDAFEFHELPNNNYSHGTIALQFVLPYFNENYEKEQIKDCVQLDQLPKFYH